MRVSFYAGLALIVASAAWSAPLVPLWLNTSRVPLSFVAMGHTLLVVGGLFSGVTLALTEHFRHSKQKQWLARHARVEALKAMPWDEFERLVGATFRQWGFRVQVQGGGHADGGIDLIVHKRGKRYLVQCKRYKGSVGVSVIREMYGVMVSENFDGVYIMTSGKFTKDGWAFAKGKPMKLISGDALARILHDVAAKL